MDVKQFNKDGVFYPIKDETARNDIGDLSWLKTTAKGSLVLAINELYDLIAAGGGGGIPQTYTLVTEDGEEITAVTVEDETVFDATAEDIRAGKVAATGSGVTVGTLEYDDNAFDIPDDTETMVYRAENLNESIAYTDLTLTSDNLAKIGYTEQTTDVFIPAAFLDTDDGIWYKVVQIGSNAFKYAMIERVFIPKTVTFIGAYSFQACPNLEIVYFADGIQLETIGDSAFRECTMIKNIAIPSGVTTIGESAFNKCSRLISISIPDSVTDIGFGCFYYCKSMISAYVGSGVNTFESNVFQYCTRLSDVTLGDGLTLIGESCFDGCTSLIDITIPASVMLIRKNAFRYALESVTFASVDGWFVATSGTATSGTAVDVSEPAVAAEMLNTTYSSYFWKRS